MSSTETQQHPFISYLQGRAEDRAMLAALRRGLGAEPGDPETADMMPYVERRIRKEASRREVKDIYMVASLFALHPSSADSGNMGDHLRPAGGSARR